MDQTKLESAIGLIAPGSHVFIHGAAATPSPLLEELLRQHTRLRQTTLYQLHTEGPADYARPEYADSFSTRAWFVGKNIRPWIGQGAADYVPVFLSEIPAAIRNGIFPINVALLQVCPPDAHGFCSLGVSVDVAKAATDTAELIIALINPCMPRSHGDGQIHISKIHACIEWDSLLPSIGAPSLSAAELEVGRNVASLVEDGATLQMGIGAIPDAALRFLHDRRDLGVHSEMFSDGILELVEKGVINGRLKKKHTGKIVGSFAMGTEKLYRFIHDNPMVSMLDAGYVNDADVIRKNPKVTAINSAIEIDLTGQVCADSIGHHIYSGVGGQMDFMRGAALSEGGKPIIAMTSLSSSGVSKITSRLKPGAGVVTTRAHIRYVVTEYGIADLYGKSLEQRAKALIAIAHPSVRESLEKARKEPEQIR